MATLAAYPEWYERSGNVVVKHDITEVAIVNNYNPTGSEIDSWDASFALDGSVMAYIVGTKLTLVCDTLTEIPDKMFHSFICLEKITGLNSVVSIGALAFWRCYSITSIDLVPENLTKIGDDAFRMSSVEDVFDTSKLSADIELGERATRSQRWGSELAAVQSVEFPAYEIFLNVPNPDSQVRDKYADIPFVTKDGEVIHTFQEGCSRFACYHAWNCLYAGTDKEYSDFEVWFNTTLNRNGDYADNNHSIDGNLAADFNTLGWERTGVASIKTVAQLEYILNELSNGFPVNVSLRTATVYHAVMIIGCNPNTRKLAFVDSGVRKDRGVILWCAYEDLCIGGTTVGVDNNEVIHKIDYKQPILAAGDSWFTQGGTTVKRASITEIEVVSNYTPTGNETASWDASVKNNGSVMAYVNGTKLTIAGNKPQNDSIYGFYSVYAHPNSSYAFSDSTGADYFAALTTFNQASLFNTNKAVTMDKMLRNCGVLTAIDVSNWDISSCRDIGYLFHRCPSIKRLDVSKWDTSNVEKMENTFNKCEQLEMLDVSNWNTSACKNMASVFQHCHSITELNLSKWDTSHLEPHPQLNTPMQSMLLYMHKLQKLTIGDNFGFVGDILQILTVPSSNYIPYADGNWYDYDYNAYAPADIPSNVARTYYASKFIAAGDDQTMVFVKNGTLRKMAVAIRHKNGKSETMYPAEFAEEVLALE